MTSEHQQSTPGPAPRVDAAGPTLREARLRRGLSIGEVAADTRINPAYLEAMEAERWEFLPAPVYARGFFRAYGRYLGLDAELVERLVPDHLPRPRDLEPAPGLRRRSAEPALPVPSFDWLRRLTSRGMTDIQPKPVRPSRADRATFGGGRRPSRTTSASRTFAQRPSSGWAAGVAAGVAAAGAALTPAATALARVSREVVERLPRDRRMAGAGATVVVAVLLAAGSYAWWFDGDEPASVATTPTAGRTGQVAGPEPRASGVPRQGEMPDLLGRTRREAEDEMTRLGLAYVVIEVATPAAPPGTVYNQSPEPGKAVKRGDSVTLLVARAP